MLVIDGASRENRNTAGPIHKTQADVCVGLSRTCQLSRPPGTRSRCREHDQIRRDSDSAFFQDYAALRQVSI